MSRSPSSTTSWVCVSKKQIHVGSDPDFEAIYDKLATKVLGDSLIFFRDGMELQDTLGRFMQQKWLQFARGILRDRILFGFALGRLEPHPIVVAYPGFFGVLCICSTRAREGDAHSLLRGRSGKAALLLSH